MKLLLVSATASEIVPTLNFLKIEPQSNKNFYSIKFLGNEISILIAGIGSYSMIYSLTKILNKYDFDLVINIGIAGANQDNIKIGEVVAVTSETIGDMGVDDNGVFKTIFEEKFANENAFPFNNGILENNNFDLLKKIPVNKLVNGLTVNTVSGEKNRIEALRKKFNTQIESMEGAAFFFVCLQENVDFAEIRSISNFIEPRSKEKWEIMTAISNLNKTLKLFILEVLR